MKQLLALILTILLPYQTFAGAVGEKGSPYFQHLVKEQAKQILKNYERGIKFYNEKSFTLGEFLTYVPISPKDKELYKSYFQTKMPPINYNSGVVHFKFEGNQVEFTPALIAKGFIFLNGKMVQFKGTDFNSVYKELSEHDGRAFSPANFLINDANAAFLSILVLVVIAAIVASVFNSGGLSALFDSVSKNLDIITLNKTLESMVVAEGSSECLAPPERESSLAGRIAEFFNSGRVLRELEEYLEDLSQNAGSCQEALKHIFNLNNRAIFERLNRTDDKLSKFCSRVESLPPCKSGVSFEDRYKELEDDYGPRINDIYHRFMGPGPVSPK